MGFFPPAMKPIASSLLSQSFPPAPGGMNVAIPANEIDDTQAVYLQDILVDEPGLARRRGPVTGVSDVPALPREGMGLAITLDPAGNPQFAAPTGDGSNGYFTVLASDKSGWTDLAWPSALGTSPYPVIAAKAALNRGTMVGVSDDYLNGGSQGLAYWAGGTRTNYSTGTVTLTRGTATVTGSGTAFLSNVTPGMWLFADTDDPYTNALIGLVLDVVSDTELTLASPSPYVGTSKSFTIQVLRGIAPRVSVGTITCDTTSKNLNGGATKFRSQGLNTGSWDIYRMSDMTWVGTVDGTATLTDTSLMLKANAAISLADEAYIALRADADYGVDTTANSEKVGFITSVYSQRQWYANNGAEFDKTYRLWFSDDVDPENLDLTEDGNFIPILSTGDVQEPIVGLAAAYNALIVVKETETFGVFGTSPEDFEVRKLEDDGSFDGMSVQQFGGGVIWAGRQGVHYYDGVQVNNLTESLLGNVWKETILTFDPTQYRMWSFMERNHYILHIEHVDPTIAIVKGSISTTPNHWIVALNMDSGAITLFQNVKHRGAITLPPQEGLETWYLVNDGTHGIVSSGSALFDKEGLDGTVDGIAEAGPDFFFESKKFDGGNPTRLKRFKYFIMHYLAAGGDVKVDAVLGLNDLGETLSTNFGPTVYTWSSLRLGVLTWTDLAETFPTWKSVINSVFLPARVRFLKKSQHMSFRLWQSNSSMTRVQIGPFEIGYKEMRPGRI